MKIKLADNAGFCFGVKRAIDIVKKEAKTKKLEIFGDLVHNPVVVDSLRKKGIKIVYKIDDITAENIVITAHNTDDKTKELLKKKANIIDTACPHVKHVHNTSKEMEKQGYQVLIIGKKEHIEVQGISGNLTNPIIILNKEDIIKNLDLVKNKKIGCVVQTTMNLEKTKKITEELKKLASEFWFENTICDATRKRQESAQKIAKEADIMLVIGGCNSSNTIELKKVCEKYTTTYHIESAEELKREWFEQVNFVGITAGASTPNISIKRVIEKINYFKLN